MPLSRLWHRGMHENFSEMQKIKIYNCYIDEIILFNIVNKILFKSFQGQVIVVL